MLDWVGGGRLAVVDWFVAGVVEGRDGAAAASSVESSLSSAGASWDAK